MFNIIENPNMVDTKIEHKDSKLVRLINTILSWNPCNHYFYHSEAIKTTTPSTVIYKQGNNLIMHPSMAVELRRQMHGIVDLNTSCA